LKVEFADPAREQVRAASAWWRRNRPSAPTLFEDELAAVVALLETGPLLTRVFDEVGGKVVRKPDSECGGATAAHLEGHRGRMVRLGA
jgi:hypothetical protein